MSYRSKSQPPLRTVDEAAISERDGSPELQFPKRKKKLRRKSQKRIVSPFIASREPWNPDTTLEGYDDVEENGKYKKRGVTPIMKKDIKKEQEELNQSWMSSLRPELADRPTWNNDTSIDGYDNVDEFGKIKRRGVTPVMKKDSKKEQDELNHSWMSSLRPELADRPQWNDDTTVNADDDDKVDEFGKIKRRGATPVMKKDSKKEQELLNESWMSTLRSEVSDRPAWNNDTSLDGYENVDENGKIKRRGVTPAVKRDIKKEQEALNETWMSSLRGELADRPAWDNDTSLDGYENVDENGKIRSKPLLGPPRINQKQQEDLNEKWMSSLRSFD